MRFVCSGSVRAFIAPGVAAFARIKMVLSIGALNNSDSFFGALDCKSLGGCFVGFHLWHILVDYSLAEDSLCVKWSFVYYFLAMIALILCPCF